MFTKIMIAGATVLALTAWSHAADAWVVIKTPEGCNVSNAAPGAGEEQLGGSYASEAEATAAMQKVAECQLVNNPDTPKNQ